MKTQCLRCIDGKLISGNLCGSCHGTGEVERVIKARLDIDLAKFITWEENHGFVLHDMNDSIYFPASEAIQIANFIAAHHGLNNSIVVVKSPLIEY